MLNRIKTIDNEFIKQCTYYTRKYNVLYLHCEELYSL